MTYEVRLRAYSPGTDTVLGLLPETLSWDASVVHNADGALNLKVSALADNGAILSRTLNQGLDVALEVNTTGTPTGWVEPDNCRYLLIDRKCDQTDPAKVLDLTLVSWSWLLNKICDLNTGALQGSKSKYAGQRLFAATSDAGDVCKKMLDEHDARSGPAVPIVRSSWTTTLDSLGHAWAKKLGKNTEGRAFPAGQPLHAKLDALTANGKCDWRTRGRGLRIYNPGTAFVDRHLSVHLRYGDDLSDAPSQTSQADRVARILVKGDGKHKATELDPSVPEFYGRWEAMLDCAGVKDDDDLEDAGEAELANRNRIKSEYTRTLTMAGKYLPFRDYNVGDYVTALGDSGDETLRVVQITISRAADGSLGGGVVLGDKFTNKDLALASKVGAISGGSSGVSGNGTSATPPAEDTRQAEAPAGFTATGSLVLGADHRWSVNLTASWAAVTTATDGTALDVSGYKLMAQPAGGEWRELTRTAAASLMLSGFVQGSAWTFAVVAIPETAKWESPWSSQVAVTFPADMTPPNKPSNPVVESAPSTVSVTWDGLDLAGAAMPGDFDRLDVRLDTVNPPVAVAAQLKGAGQYVALAEVHSTVYVSLVAYDTTGNASAATTPVSVVVKSVLDDTDLADRLATAPRFYTSTHEPPATNVPALSWWLKADGSVEQYVSGAWVAQANAVTGSVTAAQVLALLMAAASATIGDLSADAATIQTLYAQAFTAATAAIGLVRADRVIAGALDAYTITGVVLTGGTITGATFRTSATAATTGGMVLNSAGLHGYNASGVEKTKVGATGLLTADSATFTNVTATGVVQSAATGKRYLLTSAGLLGYSTGGVQVLALYNDGTEAIGEFKNAATNERVYIDSESIGSGPADGSLVHWLIRRGDSGTGMAVDTDDGDIYLNALTYINNNVWAKPSTATSSANAVWSRDDADGYRRLNFNSSLRALKKCLLDLHIDPASVLQLQPRTWFDKGQIEDAGLDPETVTESECLAAGLRRIPGFVAEEVEAVDPIFATYEGDDLQGVAYDRISAALLVLAKSQQQQIDALTARMAALEARLPLEA